jgi:hypothetical protein
MKYLPFEIFTIHSHLTSDEIFYRLRASVDTKRKWWIFTNKPFWGSVDRNYFTIWRAAWGNHRSPLVIGSIRPQETGCQIRIKMRMPLYDFIFMCIWLGIIWYFFFYSIASLIVEKLQTGIWQIDSPWSLLPPIVMFAFGCLIWFGVFHMDADRIKKYFLWLSRTSEENIEYHDRIFGMTESQIIQAVLLLTLFASLGWIAYSLFYPTGTILP